MAKQRECYICTRDDSVSVRSHEFSIQKFYFYETRRYFKLFYLIHNNNSYNNWLTGDFSVLQVSFNLSRHTGYFLIQVYVPCILIVVLSWVSFWIHREATSDRVGLGITTVLTLSTISLDSRTDLPKVKYATALDWFLLMSFGYCIATLLEFAGVHYFTKVGSGEIPIDDDEWEELIEETGGDPFAAKQLAARRRSSNLCRPAYTVSIYSMTIERFRY